MTSPFCSLRQYKEICASGAGKTQVFSQRPRAKARKAPKRLGAPTGGKQMNVPIPSLRGNRPMPWSGTHAYLLAGNTPPARLPHAPPASPRRPRAYRPGATPSRSRPRSRASASSALSARATRALRGAASLRSAGEIPLYLADLLAEGEGQRERRDNEHL